MTVLKYDMTQTQLQQLAASTEYVAYVVKSDKVRLLGVADSAKGLLTNHNAAITDLAYVVVGFCEDVDSCQWYCSHFVSLQHKPHVHNTPSPHRTTLPTSHNPSTGFGPAQQPTCWP